MLLDANATSVVAVAGAGAGLLGLGVGFGAVLRVRKLRRAYANLIGGDVAAGDLFEVLARQADAVAALRADTDALDARMLAARTELGDAIRHVAVVRYDAFQEMGGRLSFSAALLDDSGDGLVLTSINGRSETRSYAKGVKGGASETPLSPEEQQAIGFAMGRRAPVA